MSEPREIAHEYTDGCPGEFGGEWHTGKCKMAQEAIVRLVAAETARCAKVARDCGGVSVDNYAADIVADTIMEQS